MRRRFRGRTLFVLHRAWVRVRPWLRRSFRASLALGSLVVLACGVAFALGHESLIDEDRFARPLDATLVVDRDGRPLRRYLPEGTDTRWVPIAEVPPVLIEAFLAAEDQRFLEHHGLDPIAIGRAALTNLGGSERLSGASTITQQLVKLVYGRPHGLWDKPIEMARALELETRMTKDEILEQYLNRVPMGNGLVGVARASEVYFGHDLSELTLAEAALLAGIPQAPSRTEPRRHLARALRRRDYVLDRIEALAWRDAREVDAARAETPNISGAPPRPFEAPRFVDWALRERRRERVPGSVLHTTLDLGLEGEAERMLEDTVALFSARGAENAAALLLDLESGEVLVYVGAARDDASDSGGALDLLRAARQPGSTLKPFAYELFFEGGEGPATLLADVHTEMRLGDGTSFVARDFDGEERGPVSARTALSASLNLAALDVVRRVGSARFVDRLAHLGFARAAAADHGSAGLVLGGIDVTALELASAYAVLARGGRPITFHPLPSASPSETAEPAASLDPTSVALVRDILADGAARQVAFGRDLEDLAGGPFALKTGTSAGFHDAWCVVFDDQFLSLVWVGSPARRPMDGVSGFEAAAPVAARLLGAARRTRPLTPRDLALGPATLRTIEVCALSGELPGVGCLHRRLERFDGARPPVRACSLHGPDGSVHLPERYAAWAGASHARPDTIVRASLPRVTQPRDGAVLFVDGARAEIELRGEGVVSWEVDGVRLSNPSFRAEPGPHQIVAIGEHAARAVARVTVTRL